MSFTRPPFKHAPYSPIEIAETSTELVVTSPAEEEAEALMPACGEEADVEMIESPTAADLPPATPDWFALVQSPVEMHPEAASSAAPKPKAKKRVHAGLKWAVLGCWGDVDQKLINN